MAGKDIKEKGKGFFGEFKAFIARGNVMDMAVGIIVGAAFTAIVTSLVNDIISPVIGLIFNVDLSGLAIVINDELSIRYGAFISAIIDFIIIAFVVFCLVKGLNKLHEGAGKLKKKGEPEEAPAEPTTKVCPFCKSEIAIDATRCPHCTSQLAD